MSYAAQITVEAHAQPFAGAGTIVPVLVERRRGGDRRAVPAAIERRAAPLPAAPAAPVAYAGPSRAVRAIAATASAAMTAMVMVTVLGTFAWDGGATLVAADTPELVAADATRA